MAAVRPVASGSASPIFIPSKKVDLSSEDMVSLLQVAEVAKEAQTALASARTVDDKVDVIRRMLPAIVKAETQVKSLAEHFFTLIQSDLKILLVFCDAILKWKELDFEISAADFFLSYSLSSSSDGVDELGACLPVCLSWRGEMMPGVDTALFEEGIKKFDKSVERKQEKSPPHSAKASPESALNIADIRGHHSAFQSRFEELAKTNLAASGSRLTELTIECLRMSVSLAKLDPHLLAQLGVTIGTLIIEHKACAAWIRAGQPEGSLDGYVAKALKKTTAVSVQHFAPQSEEEIDQEMLQAAIAMSLGDSNPGDAPS